MSVIMNDGFLADLLDFEPRPGRAKWPKATGDPKNPVDLCQDRHQLRSCYRPGGSSRRNSGATLGATTQARGSGS